MKPINEPPLTLERWTRRRTEGDEARARLVHAYTGDRERDDAPRRHALSLALAAKAQLVSVRATTPRDANLEDDPSVEPLLAAWGHAADAIDEMHFVYSCCDDPVDTVLDALARLEPDLVIVGSEPRTGLMRIFAESRAEAITAHLARPVLIVVHGGRSFVGAAGALDLTRIAVPCGDENAARTGIHWVRWLVDLTRRQKVEVDLLHVGRQRPPAVALPVHPEITWRWKPLDGDVDEALARAGKDASLTVMATRGHDSLYDGLMGSHTERVLRRLEGPLLSVPVCSADGG